MQLTLFSAAASAVARESGRSPEPYTTRLHASPELPERIPKHTYEARTKYDLLEFSGSAQERKRANENALQSDDPAFIYQNFSGKGGLHGLDFKAFKNFHDYSQAKQAHEQGQFFTPSWIAKLIVELLEIEPKKHVADLCCGKGQFFNHVQGCPQVGIELDKEAAEVARKLYPEAEIMCMDIRGMLPIPDQHYMLGNPPFNLQWEAASHSLSSENGKVRSQDYWLKVCHEYLLPGGILAFVCPQTWLNDELRDKKVRAYLAEHFLPIFEIALPNDAFKLVGVSDFPTKILAYQKKFEGAIATQQAVQLPPEKTVEVWRGTSEYQSFLRQKRAAALFQARTRLSRYLETRKAADTEQQKVHRFQKLCFEVKRVAPKKLESLQHAFQELQKAEKPKRMSQEDWAAEQSKRTERFYRNWRRCLRPNPEQNLVRLVRTPGKLILKPYSWQAKRALTQAEVPTEWNLHQLVNHHAWRKKWRAFQNTMFLLDLKGLTYRTKEKTVPIRFEAFSVRTYFRKQQRRFLHLREPISRLPRSAVLESQLKGLELGGKKLYPHQVEDIGKALQKPSALLNWEMGTGKTLSAIAYAMCRGGKTLVIAPAILIRKTWKEELASIPEQSFQVIEKFTDLESAAKADFVLISLERLAKYRKRLQRLRFRTLVLDESDSIKNPASIRRKAVQALARKVPYTLLLTGTFTRNNAAEAYTQLAVLMNHTTAFSCEVSEIMEYSRYLEREVAEPNPHYQLPFPAIGGYELFKKCFAPKNSTVFGAEKTSQSLYNATALERLIQAVRLRRRFEEVKPEGVSYEVSQISVPMNEAERKLYAYIFEEFVRVLRKDLSQYHDGKVASMLVLMRQIMALLQAVSHPWTFPEYSGSGRTSKMEKVLELVKENPNKKIMFGSPWKPTAARYAQVLAEKTDVVFLDSEQSIQTRNRLIEEFRTGSAQVLVSTLGVLKAGVNIPEVEIVITDSYPWNFAQLSQYFFRAIRLNAQNHTDVYCLSNEGSFDTNVFQLLLAKEQVNRFIQDDQRVNAAEVAEGFGVNADMLHSAIDLVKEKTNGKTQARIDWGKSLISEKIAPAES